MTTDKAMAEAIPTITTERAVLIVLAEANELRDSIEMCEDANRKMGSRVSRVQRLALEEMQRRERELRQVAAALTARDALTEGLREAVRVMAKFIYENGRGCGTRTATERDDDMKIHRGNLYANPIAKAALDAAGGA